MSDENKKEDTPTFTYLDPKTNLLEVRNAITGDLLAVQRSIDENILYAKERKAHLIVVEGREVLVEAGLALNDIPQMRGRKRQWVYSTIVGESIAQKILEGCSLNKVCKTEGFPPYPVVWKWRNTISSFKKMVDDAYKGRGEFHRDKVLDLIDEDPICRDKNGEPIVTKDGEVVMVPTDARRLQIEGHKWLATTDNAERYANKTKVEGEVNVKHTIFQIDTGIRLPGDPGYQKDQTRIAQEIESKRLGEINGSGREAKAVIEVVGSTSSNDGDGSIPLKPKE